MQSVGAPRQELSWMPRPRRSSTSIDPSTGRSSARYRSPTALVCKPSRPISGQRRPSGGTSGRLPVRCGRAAGGPGSRLGGAQGQRKYCRVQAVTEPRIQRSPTRFREIYLAEVSSA